MDDVWGVDDSCVAGPVHLSGLLVLSLRNRKLSVCTDSHLTATKSKNKSIQALLLITFLYESFTYFPPHQLRANNMKTQYDSDLTEDVSSVPGPHEVWSVCSQSQHSLALDLLLQRLLVLSL